MTVRPSMYPSEEHLAFYHAIGMAVTQWAHVENGLYNVACCAFDNKKALGNGFAVIENFRSKLAFTDKVVMFAIKDQSMANEWASIFTKLQGLSTYRNKIAHGNVTIYPESKPGIRYALIPTFTTENKKKSSKPISPTGSLCVKDINLVSKQFGMASNYLLSFVSRLQGHKDLFQELIQQEPKPQSLDELRRQIYTMLPTRAKSSRG